MYRLALLAVATVLGFAGTTAIALSSPAISLAQARAIAIHATHGKIVAQELEREAGGSGLRYSFDVKTKTGLREVGIDAMSGKIVENAVETGND